MPVPLFRAEEIVAEMSGHPESNVLLAQRILAGMGPCSRCGEERTGEWRGLWTARTLRILNFKVMGRLREKGFAAADCLAHSFLADGAIVLHESCYMATQANGSWAAVVQAREEEEKNV